MTVSRYNGAAFLDAYRVELEARQSICFATLANMIRPVKGKYIVDLGCGPGNFSKQLEKLGAIVWGVDRSPEWIEYCKKSYRESATLKFVTANGANLSFLRDEQVNIVVMNLVVPNVASYTELSRIFAEVGRVLKPGGAFVFSDLHPALIVSPKVSPDRSNWYAPGFSYFRNGSEFVARIKLGKRPPIEFQNKHWTLETYTRLLSRAGMTIFRIAEPTYGVHAPRKLRSYKIPEYIMFGCVKRNA